MLPRDSKFNSSIIPTGEGGGALSEPPPRIPHPTRSPPRWGACVHSVQGYDNQYPGWGESAEQAWGGVGMPNGQGILTRPFISGG